MPMATMKFLPARRGDILTYATQGHDALTATGFTPTSIGLTATDVIELGTLLTSAQNAFNAANAAKLDKQAKTQALSAPGGAHDQLVAKLRTIANAARVSNATNKDIAAIGISRRDPNGTRKSVPDSPPEFTLESVSLALSMSDSEWLAVPNLAPRSEYDWCANRRCQRHRRVG